MRSGTREPGTAPSTHEGATLPRHPCAYQIPVPVTQAAAAMRGPVTIATQRDQVCFLIRPAKTAGNEMVVMQVLKM